MTPATAQTGAAQSADTDTIPVFVPMRPFWAVVSYANQLPGYIALQLALDFSPAILGILFAVMAPLPAGPTRLGRIGDVIADDMVGWWQRRRGPRGGEASLSDSRTQPDDEAGPDKKADPKTKPDKKVTQPVDPKIQSVPNTSATTGRRSSMTSIGASGLGDTLLSQEEIDAMMKLAKAGVPQRLVAQPDLLERELLLHTGGRAMP